MKLLNLKLGNKVVAENTFCLQNVGLFSDNPLSTYLKFWIKLLLEEEIVVGTANLVSYPSWFAAVIT